MADPTKKIFYGALAFTSLTGGMLAIHFMEPLYTPHNRSPRADCANNLRQIGLGLHMYSGDNNETFPDTLKALQPYQIQEEFFICPNTKRDKGMPWPLPWDELKNYGSYYYISGLTEDDESDRVHMFEPLSNHKQEGGNILFAGGYVQWAPVGGLTTESYWGILTKNGITKEVIAKATSRIIHANDLEPIEEGE